MRFDFAGFFEGVFCEDRADDFEEDAGGSYGGDYDRADFGGVRTAEFFELCFYD